MMLRPVRSILVLGVLLLLSLAACQRATVAPASATPTPAMAITTQPNTLATPYAMQPAAGICASFNGELVTVTLNADIPDPRCSKVRPDQKLNVINKTQNTLDVSIGRFTTSLKPGAETLLDTPFGEYLAPGVHQLLVSPCCGAELWLEGSR